MNTANVEVYHRLKPGQVVLFAGAEWHVRLVNDCRARLHRLNLPERTVTLGEREITFRTESVVNVCPDSELPVVRYEDIQETRKRKARK